VKRFSYSFLCFCLLLSFAKAQRSAAPKGGFVSPDTVLSIKATGTARYTDAEIVAASGLEIGRPATNADFKEASQRLGESGMFSEVEYSYTSSSNGVKLEFHLIDIDQSKLVSARFENFVWFTDEELLSVLQTRVPLFKRLLPLSGSLPDRVEEALQSSLTDKGHPGRVDYLRSQDQIGGPLTAISYRVEEVTIQIHAFDFPGASPEQSDLLSAAAQRAIGGVYDRSALAKVTEFDLMPVYLRRGFLRAAFAPSDAHVLPASDPKSPTEIEVDAVIPVTPGKVYSAQGFDWSGNSVIKSDELSSLIHLPPGEPVDAVRLQTDVELAEKLYRSRGYMMVRIKTSNQFDDDRATVHYKLSVAEGDLFRMGEIEITGLDTQAMAAMRNAWTLRQGAPYNGDYLKQFLANTRDLLPRGVHWGISLHETPDPKDKTVDVEIHFKQQ
jgi:outer membrane protein assembly factor BamA